MKGCWGIFVVFLRLGLSSFGGPVAHLGYFRAEFVARRAWLSEQAYSDLIALCQFLPGPASSQVGMALGLMRGGYGGALAAWLGFTLPSALLLILFAQGVGSLNSPGMLHGLKLVAVAVVAQAVWGMARSLCPDLWRRLLMLATAVAALSFPTAWGQVLIILLAGACGLLLARPGVAPAPESLPILIGRRAGLVWLALFALLLLGLPLAAQYWPGQGLLLVDAFYRAGALVFGGGHVVLPLLEAEVVRTGWVSAEAFVAGYGAAQAVPGPLFSFAAFLGAAQQVSPNGWLGGVLCLVAIFLPSFLLVAGALPFWARLRGNPRAQAALAGVNAGVVGLLLAALYHPVGSSALLEPSDYVFALLAMLVLMRWRLAPWLVVLLGAGLGAVLG